MLCCCNHHKNKNKPTITNVLDKLWYINRSTLPTEKPNKMIGRPAIPYRKVIDDIVFMFLDSKDTNSGRCYLKNMVLVLHAKGESNIGLRVM